MDRFVSHHAGRIDAKGRVSIPAAFRAVLARDGFDGLYVHPSLDQPALDCGGKALLAEIDGMLAALSPFSPERDHFATALLGTSEVLKPDSEGRVILSDALKSQAHIRETLVFVGHGQKFQIWEPERFAQHLTAARERVRNFRLEQAATAPAPALKGLVG